MSEIITYKNCPACNSRNILKALQAKDYTVSNETFEIWHCSDCSFRFTQNVPDIKGIGKYYQSTDYISHSDTKKGFVNRAYHTVRNRTLLSKRKLIEQKSKLKTGKILDIGAGTGAFANTMKQSGWQVEGIEPDETARENAAKNHQLSLQTMDALFGFDKNSFDVITMWHVLEHVHQLHEYLETFKGILKSNGHIFIAVPNYTSFDAKHYKAHWAAYDVPRHLYHFSPASMKNILSLHQFKIVDHKPMWFDSFYVSLLSEKYLTGKNNLLKALWTGLLANIKASGDVKKCSSVIYVIKKN
jgi:2-polyprenyl-3-methyl-5-hydroxy-6-metoxy-1,4-benzoquinol methylase